MASSPVRFRAPELRDLAREAVSQGWDVHLQRRGGHAVATNPENGARVILSATSAAGAAHSLGNARAQLRRAGLILDRPSRQRQEVTVDTIMETTQEEAPRPIVLGTQAVENRATRSGGGRYAITGDREVLEVRGHRVTIAPRADGVFIAATRDWSRASGWRNWQDADREALVARIATSLEEDPPTLERADRPQVPELEEAPRPIRPTVSLADTYPLAAALDALDDAVGPALAALERAGRTDAASLLAGEVHRSALEEEALAMYRHLVSLG